MLGELIAFLSGKGGTGKTSVCAAVATALAKQGQKVLCIDCDIGLRNLDIALAMTEHASLSFVEVYELEEYTSLPHPAFPSLHFLTAPMNCPAEKVDQTAFAQMLRESREQFDYVFLDAPAGIDEGFRLAAKFADRILLVTGPDPAAIRDAGRAGDLLELMGKDRVRLIVNRINKKIASALDLTVDDIMDRAGLPLMGIVPEDNNIVLAAAYGRPLLKVSRRGAAAACKRIAKRIQGLNVPISI